MYAISVVKQVPKSHKPPQVEGKMFEQGCDAISKKIHYPTWSGDGAEDNWEADFLCMIVSSAKIEHWMWYEGN